MPAKYFVCPNGDKVEISQCLEKCPRPKGRCLSLPTLHEIGKTRKWKGTPSTTQLLNPTRLSYLQITKDYTIDPFGMAFALLGTRHHKQLEVVAKTIDGLISEKKLKGEISGILDLLEPDELKEGYYKLIDYKTWGSFAVAKILGIKEFGEHDKHQVELQLNHYRIKMEELAFKISRLFAQCTVRDGGTWSAKKNGIDFKLEMIPIAHLEDNHVKDYFSTKSKALLTALETNKLPELCPYAERWQGKRCKGFCDLAEFCPEGAKVNKITYRE